MGALSCPNVPVIDIGGRPWFLASAVCKEMGYQNTSSIVQKHVRPENRQTIAVQTGRCGNTQRIVINEAGLYSLMASATRKDKAASFKTWLTEQVLPNYRRNTPVPLKTGTELAIIERDQKYQKALTIIRNEVNIMRQEQIAARQEVSELLQQIRGYFQLSPKNWRAAAVYAVRQAAHQEHSNQFREYYHELYEEFETDTGVRLKVRLQNMQKKDSKVKSILDVIAADKKLIKGFIPVIGAFAMRHGVTLQIEDDFKKVA